MTREQDWVSKGWLMIFLAGVAVVMGFIIGAASLYTRDGTGGWLTALMFLNAFWGLVVGGFMVDKGVRGQEKP